MGDPSGPPPLPWCLVSMDDAHIRCSRADSRTIHKSAKNVSMGCVHRAHTNPFQHMRFTVQTLERYITMLIMYMWALFIWATIRAHGIYRANAGAIHYYANNVSANCAHMAPNKGIGWCQPKWFTHMAPNKGLGGCQPKWSTHMAPNKGIDGCQPKWSNRLTLKEGLVAILNSSVETPQYRLSCVSSKMVQ